MDAPVNSGRRVSSGLFEVDLATGEVLRQGRRVPIQDQPFRVLALLLEHPGQIITREEIKSTLWPVDTYVGFDEGLNTAIRKLRVLFGDSADNPRFIETIPRRGYRFIAPVTELAMRNGSPGPPGDSPGPKNIDIATGSDIVPGLEERNGHAGRVSISSRPRRRTWMWILSVGAIASLLIWLAIWYSQPRLPTVANAVRITNDGEPKNPGNPPVTDGVNLYFVEGLTQTTGSRIAQLSAAGGETSWITTPLRRVSAIYDISPGHSELLAANNAGRIDFLDELWVQPLPAGAPYRVGNILASAACWTPDGLHIVYANGDAISLANKDGSDPRELVKVPGTVLSIRFSPDGQRIRLHVLHHLANASSIWEMEANGENLHPLFSDWSGTGSECCGSWSPDGDYYYFRAGRGNAQAIWVLPERHSILSRGSAVPRVLTSGLLRFSSPVPAVDGKRLFVLAEEPRVELLRYDLQSRRFDPYLGGMSAGPVDISPDGKWVAYVTYPDGTLWRSRIDGSEKTQLTFPPVRAYGPRWSPDGSRIAFSDVGFNHPWRISLISSSGGSPQLLAPSDTADADPTWMPDGESIVYSRRPGVDTADNGGIYRLDLRSGQVSQIPGSDGLFSPRLSPDARYISAFSSDATRLMLFDSHTNHWSTLAEGKSFAFNEWSHDGKYIYMRERLVDTGDVVRVSVKDRALEHIFSFTDFPQRNDMFTLWLGPTPDGALLLMRDRSVQEIYALDLRFR